jgi:hypothetical protein
MPWAALLMDFGSANYLGASVLTRKPQPPGTPQYQSPEAQRFEFEHAREPTARYKARPADDVYALGMMAYRLFTGRYPPPTLQLEPTEDGGIRLKSVPLVPPEKWVELSPEVATLLRRMLSEDPSARGSAAEVAQAFEQAAKTAGRQAAGARPPRPARVAVRARWFALAVGVLLVASAGWGMRWALEKSPAAMAPEAGHSSLGDVERAVPASGAKPRSGQSGIREGMPKKPVPGQLRPPCKKPLVEIQGGCWAGPGEEKPPCQPPAYEWKGKCYWPMASFEEPATSSPP